MAKTRESHQDCSEYSARTMYEVARGTVSRYSPQVTVDPE